MGRYVCEPVTAKNHCPKFISTILVSICLRHTKTKENQTNSEPQALIGELKNFMYIFGVVTACFT